MSDRKEDHVTVIIGMDVLNNCSGVKSSLKVILTVISSRNNSVCVILQFCRRESGTKSEQIQATAEHKRELHKKILIGPILVC